MARLNIYNMDIQLGDKDFLEKTLEEFKYDFKWQSGDVIVVHACDVESIIDILSRRGYSVEEI